MLLPHPAGADDANLRNVETLAMDPAVPLPPKTRADNIDVNATNGADLKIDYCYRY